ncbi:MAG: hypothetical protein K9M13_04335, partial [Simkaniaceae bacterium]|nr:hypothetical protein [Simkaniaceae bacterium]
QRKIALEKLKEKAQWLDIENKTNMERKIKKTFSVVHDYMKHIVQKDPKVLQDIDVQKGIQGIMGLARAAAERIDAFYQIIEPKKKSSRIVDFSEYQSLENFYQKQVIKKFEQVLESDEWFNEFAQADRTSHEIFARKIKDIDEVKKDSGYELLYIKKENGKPFISSQLLKNMKLITEFDEMIIDIVGDDPLIYVNIIRDRDAIVTANEIVHSVKSELNKFVKEARIHPENSLAQSVYKAIIALLAAANKENMIRSKRQKSCLAYFRDFHYYLREALNNEEYIRLAEGHTLKDPFDKLAVHLIHQLCGHFFLHAGDQTESVEFIKQMIKRGQLKKPTSHRFSMWSWILDCYDSVQHLLSHYPNGPLMKSLDAFREEGYKQGYTPIDQDNFPCELFKFKSAGHQAICIRLPSPTSQKVINKAKIVDEFKGFIRFFSETKDHQKLLIFNLQDRTSWQEHARAESLEKLQEDPELAAHLVVISIPKDTDFYFQANEYVDLNEAGAFKEQMLSQLKKGEACGFYFPKTMNQNKMHSFVEKAVEAIHKVFFDEKNILTRKNRLDFIEILYHFIELYFIFTLKPALISFSCKDAIDTGACASFGLYGFLKLLLPELSWSEEEKDLALKLIFAPALLVRERNVEIRRLSRIISILALINSEKDVHKKAFADLTKSLFHNEGVTNIELYGANY